LITGKGALAAEEGLPDGRGDAEREGFGETRAEREAEARRRCAAAAAGEEARSSVAAERRKRDASAPAARPTGKADGGGMCLSSLLLRLGWRGGCSVVLRWLLLVECLLSLSALAAT